MYRRCDTLAFPHWNEYKLTLLYWITEVHAAACATQSQKNADYRPTKMTDQQVTVISQQYSTSNSWCLNNPIIKY
jgi:hypothetical protein